MDDQLRREMAELAAELPVRSSPAPGHPIRSVGIWNARRGNTVLPQRHDRRLSPMVLP